MDYISEEGLEQLTTFNELTMANSSKFIEEREYQLER